MPTVREILGQVEALAPPSDAFHYDRIGLQVGDPAAPADRVLLCLDPTHAAIDAAIEYRANLIISHHPLIWEAMKSLRSDEYAQGRVLRLAKQGIALIAAHTNWDACIGGLNDYLAAALGLSDVRPCGSTSEADQLKLTFFAPEEAAEQLIEALSNAGAGRIGAYERCAFSVTGTGTFRGLAGAKPVIGSVGAIEAVSEVRVEMLLPESRMGSVSEVIRTLHPYDAPAFDFYRLKGGNSTPISRMGRLREPFAFASLLDYVREKLSSPCIGWGDPRTSIERLAVCGGAADDEWRKVRSQGAQALLTGEVKHHNAVEASESGFCLIQAGHYATESPSMARLASLLEGVETLLFEPEPGSAGRPL